MYCTECEREMAATVGWFPSLLGHDALIWRCDGCERFAVSYVVLEVEVSNDGA